MERTIRSHRCSVRVLTLRQAKRTVTVLHGSVVHLDVEMRAFPPSLNSVTSRLAQ